MGARPGEVRSVHLDMRHVQGVDLPQRFPGISAFLARYGLDLARDLVPVRPAAHYLMGGIRTDVNGRTSRPGLYAAGEAACTGVHGANRLASNSLLEGLVFGARAAKAMLEDGLKLEVAALGQPRAGKPPDSELEEKLEREIATLRQAMWAHAGLLREESSLHEGLRVQQAICDGVDRLQEGHAGRRLLEAEALCAVAKVILLLALARTESRGAHYRIDFPQRDDEHFRKHSVSQRQGTDGSRITFETW
jgi:L-aspartate oxidase